MVCEGGWEGVGGCGCGWVCSRLGWEKGGC